MSNFAVPYNAPPPGPTNTYAAPAFGGATQTQYNLEGFLQQLLAQYTHMTTLMLINSGITDPTQFPANFLEVAESICAEGSPPDAGNKELLAQLYGTKAELAYAQVPASQWNRATFTDYASGPDVVAPGPPSPITGIFGSPVGDGRLNLTNLTIGQINSGALKQGSVVANPADGKSYTLTYALVMAGMGMGGYWTPVATAPAAASL